MRKLVLILLLSLISNVNANISNTGLDISIAGDLVFNQGLSDDSSSDESLKLRGAEILFYAPVDHNFDTVLSAAAHDENGETNFEIHELYLASSKIIPRVNFKIGQYFLGIGRLNRFHQHDWSFTRAPKVHRTFLDDEGVFDTGLEVNYLMPFESVVNLTLGITSGYKYGHSHTAGSKPKTPTHYSRLSTFLPFSTTSGMDTGFSYLSRTDNSDVKMTLYGLDIVAKWRESKVIKSLVQYEFWFKQEKTTSEENKQVGMYIFNENSLTNNFFWGIRGDLYKDLTKKDSISNQEVNHINYGLLSQVTYVSSEFSKIRMSLSHEFDREEGVTSSRDTRLALQFIFIIGSHPAHEF